MCVLIEARDAGEISQALELWELLAEVYEAHTELLCFANDRRKVHAAELVVAAWKVHQGKFSILVSETPSFLMELSQRLVTERAASGPERTQEQQVQGDNGTLETTAQDEQVFEVDFDFHTSFQDIDWNFWSSID
jgi:hypothetical protein